ncbi:hypothetical protein Agabi119p4_8670 [Agaricus bisporus var. burnettii]|uniref:Uncharacterized protein n=1 Tax=Agaricus bisporus var. burnettii TaxID=192524 RepID=A0A8H7C3Y4_AGABI|nr:hypothetical protein Agabi119p4_8670 [Agaricus bisporus var. burnettii]
MSAEDSDHTLSQSIDKGKRRAEEATERTPLLQNGASTSETLLDPTIPPSNRRRMRTILTTVFLVSLSLSILVAVLVAILAWSYAAKASNMSPEKVINDDVVLSGPFDINVLNTTDDGGLWLKFSGRIGFDAGDALGVNYPIFEEEHEGMFKRVWKAIGRWGIETLDKVVVDADTIIISPEHESSLVLLEVKIAPIEIPLTADPPRWSNEWLTPIVAEVYVKPTKNTQSLSKFVIESWRKGTVDVGASAGQISIRGGGKEASWRSKFRGTMKNVQTILRLNIPALPGLPRPGKHAPFPSVSELLTLESFHISSSRQRLTLEGEASIVNPIPEGLHFTLPSLPFSVFLPNGNASSRVKVADVTTFPFESMHPNISLHLNGTVPALPKSSFSLLSTFLSRYLNAEPNPIIISTPLLSPLSPSDGPDIEIPAEFPAPSERPQLLRNVTIKDMHVRASGTTMLTSGIIFATVVLPKGIDVGVDVFRIYPDVLVFDGEVPPLHKSDHDLWGLGVIGKKRPAKLPQMPELPDPLPPNAFGHITPEDWLNSTSVRLENIDINDENDHDGTQKNTGAVYAVSAKIHDVPLEVLPGRQKEFSSFVSKVIFGSSGAVAGIQGYVAVTLTVDGLPIDISDPIPGGSPKKGSASLELTGLPFHGNVRVGKKGFRDT